MKKTIAFLVILTILGLGGIWWLSLGTEEDIISPKQTPKDSQEEVTYEEMLQEKEKERQNDANLYNKAISGKNPGLCEGIEEDAKKNECRDTLIALQAEASGSMETCNTIVNPDIATECRDIVSKNQAIKTGDKAFCKNVTDSVIGQSCREAIDEKALTSMIEGGTATKSACMNLEEKFRQGCLGRVQNDSDTEIYTQALTSGNINNCSTIKSEELRGTCRDTILLKQAISTNSATYCNMIQNGEKKTYCLSHVQIKNESVLFKEYMTSLNLNGCATLTDTNLKNRCHDMVTLSLARNTKNSSLCQTLTNTGMVAMCEKSAQ